MNLGNKNPKHDYEMKESNNLLKLEQVTERETWESMLIYVKIYMKHVKIASNKENRIMLQQGCYTWRYDPILLFIATTFQSLQQANIFVEIPGFISSSVVTGDNL